MTEYSNKPGEKMPEHTAGFTAACAFIFASVIAALLTGMSGVSVATLPETVFSGDGKAPADRKTVFLPLLIPSGKSCPLLSGSRKYQPENPPLRRFAGGHSIVSMPENMLFFTGITSLSAPGATPSSGLMLPQLHEVRAGPETVQTPQRRINLI